MRPPGGPRRATVALIGGAQVQSPATLQLVHDLGAAIQRAGWNLACGGGDGVMGAVCAGFREARDPARPAGISLGLLKSEDPAEANEHLDIALPTGLGVARNALVVQAGDVVVAASGGSGTLSEIALAWQYGRPIVALAPTGGVAARYANERLDDRREDQIWKADTVDECVDRIRLCLAGEKGR